MDVTPPAGPRDVRGTNTDAEPAGAVTLDVPAGWEHTASAAPLLLAARPQGWGAGFVPSVTVVHTRTPEATSLEAYRQLQLAGTATTMEAFLLHVESAHRPVAHLDLTLAVAQFGRDLTVTQRHLLRPDGEALVASATCADVDWPELAATLLACVRSVAWR